jgi:hypothetical protein
MTTYNSPFSGDVIQPTDVSYVSYTLTADLPLVWPINGNVGDVTARIMQITAETSGLALLMPDATQVSVGQDALITNVGAYAFTVEDSTGGTIISVAPGKSEYIYITDNTTPAGTWAVIAFGVGTSSPDANTLAGYGLLAISNTLNQAYPSSSITDGYTFSSSDRAQTKIWSGGTGASTLPSASTLGNNFFFLFKNDGSGTIAMACSGSDMIDGVATKNFQPNESAIIVCTGNGYITIGYGAGTNFYFTALTKSVTTGTVTLTAQEAQAIIDEFVGSLTGNVTVVYPPVVALYAITNQTTANGHTLSITTGLAGANTTVIPAGQTATVICDGTNFFNANTVQAGATTIQLVNGTVSNPSLSFSAESTTGIYRSGTGDLSVTVLGTDIADFTGTGLNINGVGNFTGGVGGGAF